MIFVSAYIQSTPYYHEGKNNVNFDSSLWQGVFDTTLHEKDLSSLSGLLCIILQQYMLLPNQVSNGTNNQHNHTSNHIIYLTQIQLNNKYQYIIICSYVEQNITKKSMEIITHCIKQHAQPVTVSVLSSNAVDLRSSPGRVMPKTILLIIVASPLSMQH